VNKPETNLLERQTKRDLVPMRICAKPYIMSERNQSFDLERIGHNFITLTKPETNLLERQSKRDLVPMRICAKPYIMSESIKSSQTCQTKHELNYFDFSL